MDRNTHFLSFSHTVRHIFGHAVITLLAVGIAFSLPVVARYILYYWWPLVEGDSQLLLITEIGFAAMLVLLANIARLALAGRRCLRMNRIASLVYVREGENWFSRLSGRRLRKKIPVSRDVSVMSVTGYDTFVSEKRKLHGFIEDCYEIRVMLMNPFSAGAKRRVQSMSDPAAILESYRQETDQTITYLAKLRAAGKKITLKFYDDPPFWNLVVTGEHVWVQYCHDGHELKTQPEYVFALQHDKPAQGLFSPFYVYFLNQWNDPRHPEFNFETKELIYRNADGNEVERGVYQPKEERRAEPRVVILAN